MDKEIKLSIIVPVYNTEKYLNECIESLINQTLINKEIILVDDGSRDNSGKICDYYASKYSNIKVIHKENTGLGFTRNSGIEEASGKFITFIDSDDFVEKNYYRKLVNKCESENADICYANGIINYKMKKKQVIRFCDNIDDLKFENKAEVFAAAPRGLAHTLNTRARGAGSVCLGIFNRNFLNRNNIRFLSEREFISEDIWFNLDCFLLAEKIIYVDEIGYYYRYNNTSLTRKYNANRFNLLIKSEETLLKHCSNLNLHGYKARVATHFWASFKKCINQEVRFTLYKRAILNIKNMCENELSNELLNLLTGSKVISKLDKHLLILILRKKYRVIYLELRIYNFFAHYKE